MEDRPTKHYSSRFVTSLAFILVAAIFAALLRRIELAAAALPFLAAVIVSMLSDRTPRLDFSHTVSGMTVFENDLVQVEFEIVAGTELCFVEVLEELPQFGVLRSGANDIVTSLRAGERQKFCYELGLVRRSRFTLGRLTWRVHGASGLIFWEGEWADPKLCVCYPAVDVVTQPVRPFHTQVNVGNYPSREASEGIEFASLREYVSGDQLRSVNWKVSQRNGRMFVNEFTRERNADIVLVVDSFADAGAPGRTVLDAAVRACASLSSYFLSDNNRVGFIEFSGIMNWVLPDLGRKQWYRILEHLTDVRERESDVARDITKVPRQILPKQKLHFMIIYLLDTLFQLQ